MEEIRFYRCMLCGKVVNQWEISSGEGCSRCGGKQVAPSDLGWWEKIVQIAKHPNVWAWKDKHQKIEDYNVDTAEN